MPTASTNPPKYRWSTDPPGKPASHTIPEAQHKTNVQNLIASRQPGAAAAPATPAAPTGPLAMPVDPTYQGQVAGAQKQLDTTLAGLAQQRTAGLIGYGYSEDPVTGALTFNPNDPFSKAMLLKRNYDQQRARTGQSMGSTGGLYTGAYQKAQDLVNIGQVGAEDSLQKSLISWLAQNTQARTNAGVGYENAVAGYDADRLDRIANNPLYTPDSSIAAPPAAPAAPTAPKAPAKGSVGKPASKTNKPPNVATGVGTTRKPRVKTYTTGVKRP